MPRTFPTVPKWTAGLSGVNAVDFQNLSYAIDFIANRPRASAKVTLAQSIPTSSTTVIRLDAADYDTDGFFVPTTNPTGLLVPFDGTYRINAGVGYATNSATGSSILNILRGGAVVASQACTPDAATHGLNVALEMDLAANDFIQMSLYQSSGAARSLDTTLGRTFLQMQYVAWPQGDHSYSPANYTP